MNVRRLPVLFTAAGIGARLVVAAAFLLIFCLFADRDIRAAEIAILKSSGISAYDQAIAGFKSTAPSGISCNGSRAFSKRGRRFE